MALNVFILCGSFKIKGVKFTCKVTYLPYKTACLPIRDVPIIDNLRYYDAVLRCRKLKIKICNILAFSEEDKFEAICEQVRISQGYLSNKGFSAIIFIVLKRPLYGVIS